MRWRLILKRRLPGAHLNSFVLEPKRTSRGHSKTTNLIPWIVIQHQQDIKSMANLTMSYKCRNLHNLRGDLYRSLRPIQSSVASIYVRYILAQQEIGKDHLITTGPADKVGGDLFLMLLLTSQKWSCWSRILHQLAKRLTTALNTIALSFIKHRCSDVQSS